MYKLILTSKGLETEIGAEMIGEKLKELKLNDLHKKSIFLVSYSEYGVDERIVENCKNILGFSEKNIYLSANGQPKEIVPDYIYVTAGNTFEILKYMRENDLICYIKRIFLEKTCNTTYIGASAGAMLAGIDVRLAEDFDRNFAGITDYTAMELFNGTILPHMSEKQFEEYVESIKDNRLGRYNDLYHVENYEVLVIEDPFHDFYDAWNFLEGHSLFEDDFNRCLYVEAVKVDPETKSIEEDPSRNTETNVWLEAGAPGCHFIELDCGGKTFEDAIVQLANLVYRYYGKM